MLRSSLWVACILVILGSKYGCILGSTVPVSQSGVSGSIDANGDASSDTIEGTSGLVTTTSVGLFGAMGITARENLQRQLLDLSLAPSTPSSLIMNTEDMLSDSNIDTSVLFTHTSEIHTNTLTASIDKCISTLLQSSSTTTTSDGNIIKKKIIFVLTGLSSFNSNGKIDKSKERKMETLLRRKVKEVCDYYIINNDGSNVVSNSNNGNSGTLIDVVVMSSADESKLASSLLLYLTSHPGTYVPASIYQSENILHHGSHSTNASNDDEEEEEDDKIESVQSCMGLADAYITRFSSLLATLLEQPNSLTLATIPTIAAEIETLLLQTSSYLQTLYNGEGDKGDLDEICTLYENDAFFAYQRARVRHALRDQLHPIYLAIVDLLVTDSLAYFDNVPSNVASSPLLPALLSNRVKECTERFAQSTAIVTEDFEALMNHTDEYLLKDEGADRRGKAGIKVTLRNVEYDKAKLAALLAEKRDAKVKKLFLQGLYNPFVRTARWAPTHININYLLDPKALAFDIKYNPLYDAHEDIITLNRAAPLIIEGLTYNVFDPNDHPVPLDNKPWWRTLQEFYFSDDDDEEE